MACDFFITSLLDNSVSVDDFMKLARLRKVFVDELEDVYISWIIHVDW